jgi:hypothetical protein
MGAGAESRDFFGFAQGKEDGRYVGFSYGKRTSLIHGLVAAADRAVRRGGLHGGAACGRGSLARQSR